MATEFDGGVRVTNDHRAEISRRALAHRFGKQQTALDKEQDALGRALYNRVYASAYRKIVDQLRDGWYRDCARLRFNLCGMVVDLKLAKPLRCPGDYNGYSQLGVVDDQELKARWLAYDNERQTLKEEQSKTEASLCALLARCSTFKQLKEVWPEGAKLYADLAQRTVLPAIDVRAINAALAL